jgi:hypothetical protein
MKKNISLVLFILATFSLIGKEHNKNTIYVLDLQSPKTVPGRNGNFQYSYRNPPLEELHKYKSSSSMKTNIIINAKRMAPRVKPTFRYFRNLVRAWDLTM